MKKKSFRVNFFTSITAKILLLLAAAIATTGVIMISIYSPNVEKELTTLAQNYLHDLAMSYGTVLNDSIDISGKQKALSVENLTDLFDGVGMEGQSSSYIYIVSPEGTMLFHPTPDKIGQPVENEVVKGVTADIKNGSWKENDVIEYEFKGAYKYASYYVNDRADYILVITVDSDELLSAIDAINSKGLTGLGMAFVFSVVVIGILVSIIVVAPILKIAELTGTIADMDFSENRIQRKLSRRKDEIGLMARSMGSLTESLSDVIANIHRSCNTLLASAETLQSGAERTTKSMRQVGSAVNEISTSANNQARDAQEATSNVVLIGDMIENTTYTVNTLMDSINEMNAANEKAKEVISALREINTESENYIDTIAKQTESTNESVLKISEATSLITDIASQTTLLSMNASIEAARAGEQGRGFAAVATEIKKLAVQSSESANTIIDIIQTLLSDSEKAVATMKKVRQIISQQTEYIVTTDKAFENIQKGVEETLSGMENISRKTSEMDGARQSVVSVVNNLSAIAEENAAATEQSAMSVSEVSAIVGDIASKADDLNSIATQLESQVSVFRL
ncbi:MAG: methyl-accepting chemotaxis protein [Oscillospiraceae bacterium]|nr:methyl-accepting chemotaxis protein [Oscillospiraceae bacterium]